MKVNSYNPDVEVKESESGAEVTIPSEEYQALKTSAKEVEELANKRVALSMAQVLITCMGSSNSSAFTSCCLFTFNDFKHCGVHASGQSNLLCFIIIASHKI